MNHFAFKTTSCMHSQNFALCLTSDFKIWKYRTIMSQFSVNFTRINYHLVKLKAVMCNFGEF